MATDLAKTAAEKIVPPVMFTGHYIPPGELRQRIAERNSMVEYAASVIADATAELQAEIASLREQLAEAGTRNAEWCARALLAEKERDQLIAGNLDAMRAKIRATTASDSKVFDGATSEMLCEILVDVQASLPIAYHSLIAKVRKQLAEAKERADKLQADYLAECEEFNAGYACAEAGGSESDEPYQTPHDNWQTGFAWQRYPVVKAQLAAAESALAEWQRFASQVTPNAAMPQERDDVSI